MRYLTFSPTEHPTYEICFLLPSLQRSEIERYYIEPFLQGEEDHVLVYDLFKQGKQTKVAIQREYLEDLLPTLEGLQVKYLVVCDAEYFKTLTKASSADTSLGYVRDSVCGKFKVVYCPNFRSVFYNPEKVKDEIRQALTALRSHRDGSYIAPGMDIVKFAAYPQTTKEITAWLQRLIDMNCDLTADIEAFSLKHYDAGIGTISFAWSKHEGISFPVDYKPIPMAAAAPYGEFVINKEVREVLKEFFRVFPNRIRWHNISYDAYVLIYQLFMEDLLDTYGLLDGLSVMLKNWDCTQIITYLATNSCAGNKLGLKVQAQEFAGNYAVDEIADITAIPLDRLLQYNLVDSLSTWFVYEKHWDTLIQDEQLEVYQTLFKPAVVDIIQMQLTGLPVDMDRVHEVQEVLQEISNEARDIMFANLLVQEFCHNETDAAWERDYETRRGKARNPHKIVKKDRATFPEHVFNANSPPQLQRLLYEQLKLPVLDLTESKLPATGGETLEKLVNHTQDPREKELLEALIDFKAVDKLLTAFIPSFLAAPMAKDGWHYLFGFFKLGGTISGRLSSSDPNLQNLPANVTMKLAPELVKRFETVLGPYIKKGKLILGKLIKSCFKAPPGWIFCGLDFASLEDRISALTTKDPNKIKVYTDGFDGHCLRAYSYFGDKMTGIDPDSVESINSIADLYPDERQTSKTPTFALTYQGTYRTLMSNNGFTEELARKIETAYHHLYRVSDEWVAEKISQAGKQGYVTVAFGLRVRTPLLHQTVLGNRRTPFEAEAEGRTAGNALGQSWCLLNSRAGSEFMGKVRLSEYRLDVRPCAQIHDAQYYMIRDTMNLVLFVNEHLVRAAEWQDHPDIRHPDVRLGGQLSIFHSSWAEELCVPNEASIEDIKNVVAIRATRYSTTYKL